MARTLEDHLTPGNGPKRILALDGGGVKGVLTLGMLRVLEAELRRRSGDKNLVLSDYYDLIGGTSTGAIIASGLALGYAADEMIDMYRKMGPDVFGKSVGDGIFIQAKFDSKKLRKALQGVLSTKSLGSADLKTGLSICMKRIDTGSAWVLTNHPKSKYWDPSADSGVYPNKRYRLIDLVLASAAAPTFFDEVVIDIEYDDRGKVIQKGFFLDGAVSGNNNPSMQLLMLALEPNYAFGWQGGANNLMMTSCGTGLRRPRVDGASFQGLPPGVRGVHALRSMIYDTQVQGVMFMQALSNPQKGWRINSEIGEMDGVCITGQPLLDYQRLDILLDQKPKPRGRIAQPASTALETLLNRALPWDTMEALDQLANGKPDNMTLLLEIGECAGRTFVSETYPNPIFDLPEWRR
ncbi:MAG: patatin-like phospholipase family protein [Hyphomonadaceae bacterium]|nr:patatin-like phospholipase family protein [Hyphomonadaceae bacterium]